MEEKDTRNELQELSEELINESKNRIVNSLEGFYKELMVPREKPVLNESVFVEYFLPFFKDFARNNVTEENGVLMQKWLEIAGTHYGEVSIVSDDGTVLFDVPGIYNSNAADLSALKEGQVDLDRMGKAYNKKMERIPQDAENFINMEIGSMPKFIRNPEGEFETQKRWLDIFKRYKDNGETITDPSAIEEDNIPASVKEDLGLIYDDNDDDDEDDVLL